MESKLVLGGRFRVFEDGSVNRIQDGTEVPATVSYTGRNKKYAAVSYQQDGKRKLAYVHRMVAAAFVPNPEKKPQVNHIDGNTRNNAADNLEWVTGSENIRHAYATGLANAMATAQPCIQCGNFTNARDLVCTECKKKAMQQKKQQDRRDEQSARYGGLELSLLSNRELDYVMQAADGLSIAEIARMYGVSRQAVEQALSNAERKQAGEVVTKSYQAKTNELARLTARRDKLLKKLEDAQLAADLARIKYNAAQQQVDAMELALHGKSPAGGETPNGAMG